MASLGDLIYIRLPGISMMIVNGLEAANELLSRRTNLNSGRTVSYMLSDV